MTDNCLSRQLESILRRHQALNITLVILELSKDPINPLEPRVMPSDVEFVDLLNSIRDIYARHWREMRAYRGLENGRPFSHTASLFRVAVQLDAHATRNDGKCWGGRVDDGRVAGNSDATLTLATVAQRLHPETREALTTWEGSVDL
jgi:hypothetical protein